MTRTYTIGQLASAVGVPASTVRYYERRGLMQPDTRTRSNYRVYSEGSLDRLRFIRSAQEAGFTLSNIEALLGFQDSPDAPCEAVQSLIGQRLDEVREERARLARVERLLRDWLAVCRAAQQSGRCGVLEGLAAHEIKNRTNPRESP